MKRYIIDNVKDGITYAEDNRLRDYIDMGGRGKERPLSYSTVEKTFYSFFIFQEPLESNLDFKMEEGMNAYGYQGIGVEKDMQQFAQARQKIVHILSQAPEMFGEPQDIDALMFEIGSGWAMLPLLYDMHKKGIDFTRFNPTAPVQQSTEPVMGK